MRKFIENLKEKFVQICEWKFVEKMQKIWKKSLKNLEKNWENFADFENNLSYLNKIFKNY